MLVVREVRVRTAFSDLPYFRGNVICTPVKKNLYFNSKLCKRLPKKLPVLTKSQVCKKSCQMVMVRLLHNYESPSYYRYKDKTQDKGNTKGCQKFFT